jgi:hypothetical protein
MNYSDRKYRQNIDNLINNSLNYVLNEVNNTQQNQNQQGQQQAPNYFGNEYRFTKGTWSLDKDKVNQPFGQNDEEGYNINPDDYTIVKKNPRHSGWSVVTARNGYQAWFDTKNKLHPVITQLGWFDKCTDFNGRPNDKGTGGIFKNKEKRHYAIGLKDNQAYKVYADGDFEPYANYHNYSMVDAQGNKTTGNYYNEGMVNSDGTYTTSFIQDPNNQKEFNPNNFLRIRFDDRSLLQKFFYIWGNTMNNSNRGNNLKVGYNDNGGQDVYYFIDMPNGPGIYDYVINLYDNLENGTIKYNEIDKNTYRDTRSQTPGKRQNPYNISVPNNPAQFTHINENIDQQSNERPDIIVFGNRIEYEDNIMANLPDPKTMEVDPNDKFYGLFTNINNQKFYYRFKDPYVYVSVDNPYLANNLIGEYTITNDLLQLTIFNSATKYVMNYNFKQKQNVVNSTTSQTVGTMQFWQLTAKDRDPFYGSLNEKQIKKITKQILKEYIYGKTM